jgi:hypothetical protein
MSRRLSAALAVVLFSAGCTPQQSRRARESARSWEGVPHVKAEKRVAPDVTFTNLKYAKLHLAVGEASTVELDVINRGQEPSGPFRVAVFASPGGVVTANRVLLGSASVESLTNERAQPLRIPITAPDKPGGYAIAIEVDDQRQVPNDDRANNRSGPSQLIVK